jgi:hypothetical protein
MIGVCSPLTPPHGHPTKRHPTFSRLGLPSNAIAWRVPAFLFGGLIGGASGAFLAANRFQVVFLGQGKLGDALICGHSAAP